MWDATHETAFIMLKQAMALAPVLLHFDWTKPMIAKIDASSGGAGAILLQQSNLSIWHPVA